MSLKAMLGGLAAGVLAGCATPIPYQLPQGVPVALIKSDISGAYGMNDSLDINVLEGQCRGAITRKRLFAIHNSVSKPAGYVQVPANQPIRLQYSEGLAGGRWCSVTVETVLEEGKTYSLKGGLSYTTGILPIFVRPDKCSFGIEDDASHLPVPVAQSCTR